MLHVVMCKDHTLVLAKLDIQAMGKRVLVRDCKNLFLDFFIIIIYFKNSRRTTCYSENVMSTAQSTEVFFYTIILIFIRKRGSMYLRKVRHPFFSFVFTCVTELQLVMYLVRTRRQKEDRANTCN